MTITITMSREQADIIIPILHREIGYCGEDDERIEDLVETLELAIKKGGR